MIELSALQQVSRGPLSNQENRPRSAAATEPCQAPDNASTDILRELHFSVPVTRGSHRQADVIGNSQPDGREVQDELPIPLDRVFLRRCRDHAQAGDKAGTGLGQCACRAPWVFLAKTP